MISDLHPIEDVPQSEAELVALCLHLGAHYHGCSLAFQRNAHLRAATNNEDMVCYGKCRSWQKRVLSFMGIYLLRVGLIA